MDSFRATVQQAAHTYLRGEVTWTTSRVKKTRGGKFFSEFTHHTEKDAILRHVSQKTVEITLPSGITFRKLKDSHGFRLGKVRLLKPKGYQILLKKRSCPHAPENSPSPSPSKSSPCGMTPPALPPS